MATETSSLLELNLSIFEYRELSNQAMDRMGVSMDFITQIIFAMLIASFFIAHRLSRSQLILVMSLYSLLVAMNLYIFASHVAEFEGFSAAAGLPVDVIEVGSYRFPLLGPQIFLYFLMYLASLWWVMSCRKNQSKQLESPL